MSKLYKKILWLGCLLANLAYAENAKLTAIQFAQNDAATRVTMTLNQNKTPRVFALSNPERLVIDLEDTQLAVNLKNINVARTPVRNIRSGHPKPGMLRLVVDTGSRAKFKVLSQPMDTQVIIDFSAGTKKIKSLAQTHKQVVAALPTAHDIVVVIDPGHGGKDPGAIGDAGTQEKNVVLSISRQLAEIINQQPNMRAVLTRNGDYFITLRQRLRLARKGKADLFVAIHADSYFNSHARGVSVYALSQHGATSEAARWLARRDNYSELGGVDLRDLGDQSYLLRSVLIDLAQTATITDSLRLGTSILDALDRVTDLHYARVEQAPFMVLKSPDIPSILVETGFISNAKEELRLRDRGYQAKIAQALFDGIRFYLKKYPPTGA